MGRRKGCFMHVQLTQAEGGLEPALLWSLGALGARALVRKAGKSCVAQLIASKPFPGSKKLRLFVEQAFTTRCKPLLGGCPIVLWLLATSLEAEREILGKAQPGAWRGDRSEEGSQQVQLYLETVELTPGNKHSSCSCILSPVQEPSTEQVPVALEKRCKYHYQKVLTLHLVCITTTTYLPP